MMRDRLSWLYSFVRVVETGSFSAVARELNTTQPTISKQIAALEAYLDVQLLVRSPRQLRLTDAGERFLEQCQQVLAAVAAAEASVGKRQEPSGHLRLNCSVDFGQLLLIPKLPLFLARYPDISVELSLSDHFIDLATEGIDVAIRIGENEDSQLIGDRLGSSRLVAIGALSYFEAHGLPQQPSDLSNHNCIVYTRQNTGSTWHFRDSHVSVSGTLRVSSSTALRAAIAAGIGIGTAPLWAFSTELSEGILQLILTDYEPAPLAVNAVYRRTPFVTAKVRAFIAFLQAELKPHLV